MTRPLVFAYFSQDVTDYTPIDIGYVVASLRRNQPDGPDVYIHRLRHERAHAATAEDRATRRDEMVQAEAASLLALAPQAVFFFLDSVIWSKVFALGRASAIAAELRKADPGLMIGLCSYKLQQFQIDAVLSAGTADIVVAGEPETALGHIDRVLAYQPMVGVHYQPGGPSAGCSAAPPPSRERGLDHVPSPYLSGVLDEHLARSQALRDGLFRAFLSSSRGCQFSCQYCSRSVKFEKVRYFSAQRFYDEIAYLHGKFGICRFFVLDDAFLCSKKRLAELTEEFERRVAEEPALAGIALHVMARPESIDEDVIDAMARLRVVYLQIGLQTINPALQHYMGRPIDVDVFREIRLWLHRRRIALQLDVIQGFPHDSVEWMNATVRYATSLRPYSIQLKQLYLNPFTMFDVRKDELGIVIDGYREVHDADFDAPYVIGAAGLEPDYYERTRDFIRREIEATPHIRWKYLSRSARYVSPNFYPGRPKAVAAPSAAAG